MGCPVFDSPLVQRSITHYEPTEEEKRLITLEDLRQRAEDEAYAAAKILPSKRIIRGTLPSSLTTSNKHCDYCGCDLKGSEIKNGCCPNCGAPVRR